MVGFAELAGGRRREQLRRRAAGRLRRLRGLGVNPLKLGYVTAYRAYAK